MLSEPRELDGRQVLVRVKLRGKLANCFIVRLLVLPALYLNNSRRHRLFDEDDGNAPGRGQRDHGFEVSAIAGGHLSALRGKCVNAGATAEHESSDSSIPCVELRSDSLLEPEV